MNIRVGIVRAYLGRKPLHKRGKLTRMQKFFDPFSLFFLTLRQKPVNPSVPKDEVLWLAVYVLQRVSKRLLL